MMELFFFLGLMFFFLALTIIKDEIVKILGCSLTEYGSVSVGVVLYHGPPGPPSVAYVTDAGYSRC